MSKKVSVFYPKYRLLTLPGDRLAENKVVFRGPQGEEFVAELLMFGVTQTQKVALKWLSWQRPLLPPVVSISHQKPTAPDKGPFRNPDELHRHYTPYAMAVATAELLGEKKPRNLKIYFCDVELHEAAKWNTVAIHSKHKGTYVVWIS